MAYDIKGDVNVARSLTAGSNITAAGYDLSIPVTAATTGTPLNVDLANGHRAFAMIVDTNSTGTITINDPTNVGVAKTLTLRLTNLDVVARTFTLSSEYVRSDGTLVSSITLVAGDTRVIDFVQTNTSPALVWATVADTGLAISGGLTKQGTITSDADAGEGIYNMDASGAAFDFTLPVATGTQKRYMLVGEDVATNNTTVKVQAGEALNGVTNGTFTMASNGETLLAIDRANGAWDLSVVGAAQSKSLHSVSRSMTNTSFAGFDDPVIFDTTNDDTGGLITNSSVITVVQDGKYAISIDTSFDFDEATNSNRFMRLVKNLPVPVNDVAATAAEITNAYSFANNTTAGVTSNALSVIVDLVAGDTLIAYFEAASANDRIRTCHMTVTQVPNSEVVLAGMVVPSQLSNIEIGLNANSSGNTCPFDQVLMNDGQGLSLAGSGVTILTSGRYRIEAFAELLTVTQNIEIRISGLPIQTYTDGSIQARPKPIILNLIAGQVITLYTATSATWLGGASITSTDTNFARLLVTQLQTSSVIRPEDALVTTTALAKMSNAAAQSLTPAGAINTLVYDTTNFATGVALVPAAGTMTIGAAGIYEIVLNASVDNSINSASYTVTISVDGAVVASQGVSASIQQLGTIFNVSSGPLNLASGAVVTAEYSTNNANTRTTQGGATVNWISIKQLSGNVVS